MRPSLGIDLGTTTSVAAVNAQVLPSVEAGSNSPLLPSMVSFLPEGGALIGTEARRRKPIDPKNTVYASKRLMGESFSSDAVRRFQQQYPHQLEARRDGGVQFVTRAGQVSPPDVGALIVSHLCRRAAVRPDEVTTVVTVPSAFHEPARRATADAIHETGITHLRLLEEPVATAVAYLHRANLRYAAVYDLGGGTFDFALLDCSRFPFRVLAHGGDRNLGGDDIDSALAAMVSERVLEQTGCDLRSDPVTYARLTIACEQNKCALASQERAVLDLAQIEPSLPPHVARFVIDRTALENAARPLIQRTFSICDEALSSAGLKARDIQAAFMAGGSTRLFMLEAMVSQYFGRRVRKDLNPEHVVALGASMVAARSDLWPLLIPG
jgi:molecular chaperone DnaK